MGNPKVGNTPSSSDKDNKTKEVNVIRKVITALGVAGLIMPTLLSAQITVGFVQSDRIRTEYSEFKDAESQLQLEYRKVNLEYSKMVAKLDSLKQSFETQRLMSSPEWRKEKEQEIVGLERNIQNFQVTMVGPEGELYRRQAQLEFDILSKVKRAVDKVAAAKGIDFILDGSVAMLYGNPAFDLTDDVLFELRKYNIPSSDNNEK